MINPPTLSQTVRKRGKNCFKDFLMVCRSVVHWSWTSIKFFLFGGQSTFLTKREFNLSFKKFWTFLARWEGALSWIKMKLSIGNNFSRGIISFHKCSRFKFVFLDLFSSKKLPSNCFPSNCCWYHHFHGKLVFFTE